MSHPYDPHASARHEAFDWNHGTLPSADAARRHFASKAMRDPAHHALFAEAADILLAIRWKIPRPRKVRPRSDYLRFG